MQENIEPIITDQKPEILNKPHWYTRAAAYLIDVVLLLIVVLPITILISLAGINTGIAASIFSVLVSQFIIFAIFVFYFSYLQHKNSQTLGMKWLGLEIKNLDGNTLTFQTTLLRTLVVVVPTFILGFVPFLGSLLSIIYLIILGVSVLIDKNNQGFHDKMFNSKYGSINEKATAAKWVLGCSCGFLTLLFVSIAVLFFIGLTSILSNPNLRDLKLPKMGDTPGKVTIPTEISPSVGEKTETPKSDSSEVESTFYRACMDANTDAALDISEYCKCAEKEAKKTSDVNTIVNNCKSLIKIN